MHEEVLNVEPCKNNARTKLLVASVVSVLLISAGIALAYLTASDSLKNSFTLDTDLSIALSEPSFVPEDAIGVVPAQTLAKDPTVENDGSIDAFVAASVKVPVFNGEIVNSEGKLEDVEDNDLFSFDVNEGWTQYGDAVVKDGYRTYTYLYSEMLPSSQSTKSLFDQVTMANLTKDIGVTETSMDITAYAIQSYGFDSSADAYEAYLNQSVGAAEATI